MSNDLDYITVKSIIECWYKQTEKVRPDLAQPEQMLTVLKYLDKKKSSVDFSVGNFSMDRRFTDIRNEIMYRRHAIFKMNRKNPYAIVLHPKDYDSLIKCNSARADFLFKADGNLRFMGMKVVTHNAMEENKIKFAFSQGEVDAFLQQLGGANVR